MERRRRRAVVLIVGIGRCPGRVVDRTGQLGKVVVRVVLILIARNRVGIPVILLPRGRLTLILIPLHGSIFDIQVFTMIVDIHHNHFPVVNVKRLNVRIRNDQHSI